MARRRKKTFVPRQTPPEAVRQEKNVETKIASIDKIWDDEGHISVVKMTFDNGCKYDVKEKEMEENMFRELLYCAEVGEWITLVTYASKIIAVKYYC